MSDLLSLDEFLWLVGVQGLHQIKLPPCPWCSSELYHDYKGVTCWGDGCEFDVPYLRGGRDFVRRFRIALLTVSGQPLTECGEPVEVEG